MDQPLPSQERDYSFGKGYCWIMTATERAHIAQMLMVDISELSIRGNIMLQDRGVCSCCGKHTGLDDMVHNAMFAGVHTQEFMLNILKTGPTGPSPAHSIICSRCGTKHEGDYMWIPPAEVWDLDDK
ncbi:hypothetical protein CNMCM8980_002261 [Aspergillus fumigatiaffinis]|uniref:RBP protein n=1 Tax=Aspergillus fumigatiaffinis TaxID=340414 RepID=A0A8H4HGC4_9EURO|nr:hypothetical protein CNMCM6457_005337 [Aspergillus fumigatiaffinis]KAF4243663.1 hypothetical protein CNMCM6805_000386 [Aspergillus fumigatiaffinis]KAF4249936.1 hypothetical protein CNMCM8980_002261 [Aspergillus fumigatiaffinis]